MNSLMESISQNMRRFPLIFSGLTLGPLFIFCVASFSAIRAQTTSVGFYSMCFIHISVFSIYMAYFEYKMTTKIKSAYYFCVVMHFLLLFLIFVMLVYSFFLGDSFLKFLKDYNYMEEVKAFQYYFDNKTAFGIGLIILFLIQVSRFLFFSFYLKEQNKTPVFYNSNYV